MIRFVNTYVLALLLSASLASRAQAEESFHWLVGHWCTQEQGRLTEELWLPGYGGTYLGVGRTRTKDSTLSFEYLRIVELDGTPQLLAQPGGRPPTHFVLTFSDSSSARFENPKHDFPQRITYKRDAQRLTATVAGGNDQSFEMHYRRCEP